ncbi:hypothetical protein VP1G_05505 [Cytospora mali]|uniref:Hypervirulence associated protein TUDOR domain-containing protein n=1 Tax=Cytospora mali TaxID=578113 RepID=A0A194V2S2_CYTMA|nr:hypothetical protein VP1G_05505 [Valsa mali var. pyri (nom. inval.)]
MPADIKDKDGQPIKEGDEVWTKARGGKHEGIVDRVVTTEAEAEKSGVKNPPKVNLMRSQDPGLVLIWSRCCSKTSMDTTWHTIQARFSILMGSRDERSQWIGKTRGFELHYGDETLRAL